MRNILVIAPSWVGDAVMAEPLYRRLAEHWPGAAIDLYAPAWTLPLAARMDCVRQGVVNPFGHGALRLAERWREGRALAAHGYDQAIVLPNSLKSALIPWFAGIPQRTGFVGEFRRGVLNDARRLDKTALPTMVERFCALAEDAGAPPKRPIAHPRLNVSAQAREAALQACSLSAGQPVMALCPGAEYGPAKRWPAAHFARLAQDALARGWQAWVFGSGKDQAIADEIVRLAGAPTGLVNLCGRTGLDQAIDLMSLARLAVCNDSGLMHIAAALRVPLVALYGSSSPGFTPPLSDQAEILSLKLDCSPCFKRECPLGHTHCLTQLTPDQVWPAVGRLLPDSLP